MWSLKSSNLMSSNPLLSSSKWHIRASSNLRKRSKTRKPRWNSKSSKQKWTCTSRKMHHSCITLQLRQQQLASCWQWNWLVWLNFMGHTTSQKTLPLLLCGINKWKSWLASFSMMIFNRPLKNLKQGSNLDTTECYFCIIWMRISKRTITMN